MKKKALPYGGAFLNHKKEGTSKKEETPWNPA